MSWLELTVTFARRIEGTCLRAFGSSESNTRTQGRAWCVVGVIFGDAAQRVGRVSLIDTENKTGAPAARKNNRD